MALPPSPMPKPPGMGGGMPPMPGQMPPGAGAPPSPGPPGNLNMPKSPIGGPSGPGATPMVSPGGGAGMKARAHDSIKAIMGTLLAEMKNFEPGTTEFNALSRAMTALNGVFGKASSSDTMGAAVAQGAALGRPGGQMPGAPPAGMAGPAPSMAGRGAPSGMPPGGSMGPGM